MQGLHRLGLTEVCHLLLFYFPFLLLVRLGIHFPSIIEGQSLSLLHTAKIESACCRARPYFVFLFGRLNQLNMSSQN